MRFEKIGNIANFINGAAFKPEDWSSNGMKIIRIQNLTDKSKPYNYTTRKVDDKYIVRKGDVLVSWSATIDVFIWEEEDALLNQHIFKVDFDFTKVDKYFFIYSIRNTINELSKNAHGSTMKHIVKGDFEKHKIFLPPLEDQIRIATILSKAEALIKQRKEGIDLLDEYLKSTFLEMFGNPVKNEKGWANGIVGKFTDCIVPGRDKPKSFTGTTPWFTTVDLVHKGFVIKSRNNLGLTDSEILEVKAKRIPIGSVIMTCVGDLGIVSINKEECIVNQQLHAFICKPVLNNIFLMYNLSFMTSYMYKMASTTTVPYMNKTICNSIPIIVPDILLQNKFSDIVEKVEAIKVHYKNSLQELENLYGALSQKAFKGELNLEKAEEMLMAAEPEVGYGKK